MTKRKIEYWVIPPEQDAEFVACMEEVLETYAQAYDPTYPVLCMDEQPVQLLKETRVPIAATTKHGRRVDYEYERHGTASIFLFAEPLSGFRQATARPRRTRLRPRTASPQRERLPRRRATASAPPVTPRPSQVREPRAPRSARPREARGTPRRRQPPVATPRTTPGTASTSAGWPPASA